MTLKWAIAGVYATVTRIDRPVPAVNAPVPAGGTSSVAEALAGKSCRADLSGVYFTTASVQVLDPSMPALERFAPLVNYYAGWRVTIEGHTDNIGRDPYNLDLSQRRAAAVRQALITRYKIDGKRVQTNGYGASRPKDPNNTIEGRARNRRVELMKVKG